MPVLSKLMKQEGYFNIYMMNYSTRRSVIHTRVNHLIDELFIRSQGILPGKIIRARDFPKSLCNWNRRCAKLVASMDSGRNGGNCRNGYNIFNEKVKSYSGFSPIQLSDQYPYFRSDQIIEETRYQSN